MGAGATMAASLRGRLTALAVKNAAPGRHGDGGGLYLVVKPNGTPSWVFRYRFADRMRDIGLGPASGATAVSLAEARTKATLLRAKLASGIDPLEERQKAAAEAAAAQAARATSTFRATAERFIEMNEAEWSNPKHRQQWRNTLATYVYPVIGDMAVDEVTTDDVLRILRPIWTAKPETARRVRSPIEKVLGAARASGKRTGENPARWEENLDQLLPARTRLSRGHRPAMPCKDVPNYMARLRDKQAMSALALEFTILTAARTGMTRFAQWVEFDLESGIWLAPAKRMKTKREHRVPSTPRLVEILEHVAQLNSRWVFSNDDGKPLSENTMLALPKRMRGDLTVHGFRSSFRDWAAEETGHDGQVCEMALAHVIGNKVEAVCRRGDLPGPRRRLMEDWERFCLGQGSGTNVVQFPAVA